MFPLFSESISMDNRTLPTVVNENEEAPIDRFTIKNEPDEVEESEEKQGIFKFQVTYALYISSTLTALNYVDHLVCWPHNIIDNHC